MVANIFHTRDKKDSLGQNTVPPCAKHVFVTVSACPGIPGTRVAVTNRVDLPGRKRKRLEEFSEPSTIGRMGRNLYRKECATVNFSIVVASKWVPKREAVTLRRFSIARHGPGCPGTRVLRLLGYPGSGYPGYPGTRVVLSLFQSGATLRGLSRDRSPRLTPGLPCK
eukprot:2845571-Rhodomonas_salina.1